MKNILALLLIAGLATTVQAQLVVTGDANYSTNSESVGGTLGLEYWVPLGSVLYLTPNARYQITENKTSSFSLNAELRANLPKVNDFYPYVGAGYGYYRFSATRNAFDDLSIDRNGFNALGGVHYNNGNVRPYVQARYFTGDGFDDFMIEAGVRASFSKSL